MTTAIDAILSGMNVDDVIYLLLEGRLHREILHLARKPASELMFGGLRKELDTKLQRAREKGSAPKAVREFIDSADWLGTVRAQVIQKELNSLRYMFQHDEGMYANLIWPEQIMNSLGWTLPTKEAVDFINSHMVEGPVYDVLAGTGLWTAALNKAGIPAKASDMHVTSKHNVWGLRPKFSQVKRARAEAVIAKHLDEPINILLAWPPTELSNDVFYMPKIGSIFFVIGDFKYLRHVEYRVDEIATLIGKTDDLVNTGASANSYKDTGHYPEIRAYKKIRNPGEES